MKNENLLYFLMSIPQRKFQYLLASVMNWYKLHKIILVFWLIKTKDIAISMIIKYSFFGYNIS
jgi:hypothetical protein